MSTDVMRDNFRDANEALRGLEIPYWIDCGTLLGHVRDDGFIPGDVDVDFSVFTDRHEDIAAWFDELRFTRHHFYGQPGLGYEQSFKRDGCKVDVFYFQDTPPPGGFSLGKTLWQGSWWRARHLIVSEFTSVFLDPEPAVFLGEWTYAPRDAEAVLAQRYDEDWGIPKIDWKWYRDPRCIRPDTLPPADEMAAYEARR